MQNDQGIWGIGSVCGLMCTLLMCSKHHHYRCFTLLEMCFNTLCRMSPLMKFVNQNWLLLNCLFLCLITWGQVKRTLIFFLFCQGEPKQCFHSLKIDLCEREKVNKGFCCKCALHTRALVHTYKLQRPAADSLVPGELQLLSTNERKPTKIVFCTFGEGRFNLNYKLSTI